MKHHRRRFALSRSAFLRFIPLAKPAPLLPLLPAAPITPVPRPRRTINPKLVWMANDHPIVLHGLKLMLTDAGYRCRTFTDRADAMNALWTARVLPALVISDCQGHRMDIDTFMLLCREEDPRIKILLNTMYSKKCVDCYRNKPDAYIHMTRSTDVLVPTVNRLLRKKRPQTSRPHRS